MKHTVLTRCEDAICVRELGILALEYSGTGLAEGAFMFGMCRNLSGGGDLARS
jgi:hypothetical protein